MRAKPSRTFKSARVALLGASLLLATTPLAALHPNHPIGFDPERASQATADRIDVVDLFSGSLALSLPLGQFTLNYSSNIWRYKTILIDGQETIEAFPDRRVNAGLGWHLGWGEVYHKDHALNDTGGWLYIGADGAHHTFYAELHRDDDSGLDDPDVFYTRDGSYLRLHKPNNFYVDISFPDGTTRRFDSGTGGLQSTYFLQKVWSPFASADDPDVSIEYDRESSGKIIGLERTVTDRHGRTHYAHFTDEFSWLTQVVTQVDLEGFAGQRMKFDFTYDHILVSRSCKDDNPNNNDRIAIPHLRQVTLPDGTAYSMKEDSTLLYYNICKNEQNEHIDDVPGVLKGINLPTGGKIRWSFQENDFPHGSSNEIFSTSAGVEFRRLLDADADELGSRRYKTSSFSPGGGVEPEVYTEVSVQPEGDCTKHFFSGRYWVSPAANQGWEYGLPFVYSDEVDGKFLSRQVFAGSATDGSCSGVKLRSTYLRFRHDTIPGTSPPTNGVTLADFYNTNRTVEATRVIFHDDAGRYADSEMNLFDGLGHFRQTIETGTFRSSPSTERLETWIGFNRATGVYPGNYVQPGPDEAWILDIFDEKTVNEDDAVGESIARVEYGFERDTGFLTCTRALASGTSRNDNDLLTVMTRDPADPEGHTTDAKRYGGDIQQLATTGADCGTVPSQPSYWNHHDYQFGTLVQTTPRTSAGADGAFPTYDVDLDPSTGWPLNQRDSAGYSSTFFYDQAGRLRSISPQDGAITVYDYINASPGVQASVTTTRYAPTGGTILARTMVVLDDFGRPRLERRLLPNGTFAERETKRNARAWTTSVSEWGNLAKTTQFLNFDAFGRATTVRPPDGASHDVRITYEGGRVVTTESKIALVGGETYVPTIQERDRYGRLRTVRELSGADSPGVEETPTNYDYDVGGRLTRIVSGVGTLQTRSFEYDNRGFLLSETHPEKGATGNGTVNYSNFDAAGRAHRMLDGPRDIGYTYDFLGRQTHVRDLNQGNRLLTHLKWDDAVGFGLGKLCFASEYNYMDLPWNAEGEEPVRVRQLFRYQGIGGAASRKDTTIFWSLDTTKFRQVYAYDNLGNIATTTYPRCITPSACTTTSAGTVRTISNSFTSGWLTQIPGWISQIDYLPSGAVAFVQHANGVIDHFTPDPDFSLRPSRLHTTGVLPATLNFDSGTMTYDGAGFLDAIGADSYAYDKVGRLVSASVFGGLGQQTYSYDRFGNLTDVGGSPGIATGPMAIDTATNRLTASPWVVYDGAGNLEDYEAYRWRYDTSNRVVVQKHMNYAYDSFGERVLSIPNAGLGEEHVRFHFRDLDHQRSSTVDLTNGVWDRDRDFVYAAGRLLATSENGATEAEHFHADHLGSTRLITIASGQAKYEWQLEYLPYGEEITETRITPVMFTGHERDFSTDADYMHARHYHFELGRFLSIDPLRGDPAQPQTLNRYAYVTGNPMNFTDPTGLEGGDRNVDNNTAGLPTVYDTITVVASRPGPDAFRAFRSYGSTDNGSITGGSTVGPGAGLTSFWALFLGDGFEAFRAGSNVGLPRTRQEALDEGWTELPDNQTTLHQQGEGNEDNKKLVNDDGRELIVDGDGKPVFDPTNRGTFNFWNATPGSIFTRDGLIHGVYDIAPWAFFGTGKDDPGPLALPPHTTFPDPGRRN